MLPRRSLLFLLAAAFLAPPTAPAQQPVRRWERPGFDFSPQGVWRRQARNVRAARMAALARSDHLSLNAPLARGAALRATPGVSQRSSMAVTGTLRAPTFLIAFRNTVTAGLAPVADYDAVLFASTPPFGRPFTMRTFYEEMSDGLLSVQGQVVGWIPLDSNDSWYEGSCNGLVCGDEHVAEALLEAVRKSDATVDFRQYDSDGPDGVPNSGDDDGRVDLMIVIQPEVGGECAAVDASASSNTWSHRFSISGRTGGAIATADTGASGNPIAVDDYIIQPGVGGATSCTGTDIMPIGTLAHELGHGLNLPDLYDTEPADGDDSEGIGEWGLMGSGNYARPLSPAHMEGWSRLELGWVTVRDLTTAGTYALGAYTVSDTIFRIVPTVGNPRNEYFLVENRQAQDGDTALIAKGKGPGLLVYHIDGAQILSGTAFGGNSVNTGGIHGVWILQADGLNQLRSSTVGVRNRGDAGDPFPGSSGNSALGFTTTPSNRLNGSGASAGFQLDSIRSLAGDVISLRFFYPAALAAGDTVLRAPVMGAPFADTLTVTGGAGAAFFSLLAGTLPPGLSLGTTGIISGIASMDGAYTFTVRAASAGLTLDLPLRLTVTAPQLAAGAVANQLLLGVSTLTVDEMRYVDLQGNANGSYDVGDVLAWLDRNPGLLDPLVVRRLMAGGRP